MIFNLNKLSFLNLSVYFFLLSFLFDFEIFSVFFSLFVWHLWNGIANIVNDYIYFKYLKYTLLFCLQISALYILSFFINILF